MTNDRIWILLARQLSGEASLTELEELEQLKNSSPNTQKSVEEVGDWWSHNEVPDTEFLEATYLAHLERMKDKGFYLNEGETKLEQEIPAEDNPLSANDFRNNFKVKRIVVSAIVVATLALSWFFLKPEKNPTVVAASSKPAEVSTRNGTRSKILLPDGTNVWLNSGSKITYNKDIDTNVVREVYLTGEAFFDVVKNPKRPFIIHTANMDVKVLGTRFNVKAYAEDKTSETSLIKGSVEVYLKNDPGRKYLLKPNQKLVLSNNLSAQAAKAAASVALQVGTANPVEIKPLTYLGGSETDVESSWTKNLLSFEDEAFIEVAKKLERWYDVSFVFKNKTWEQQFLNGSFEKESLEQALKALQYSTGFNYKIEGKTIFIF